MKIESRGLTLLAHITLFALALFCIIPFVLMISASLTDDAAIAANGYSFIPDIFSWNAYDYLFNRGGDIYRAFGVSVFVTVFGTALGVTVTTLLAYALARKETPHRYLILFIVFFTMLFNGGLIPTYVIYTQLFDIKNTIWALIFPGLLTNGFYIMMARIFFQTSLPEELIESSKLDGASEYRTLWSIVIPISGPIMATMGLFIAIMYWNDWQNGMVYLTDPNLFSLQNLLNRIMEDINFIQSMPASQAQDAMQRIPANSVRMAMAVIGALPILLAYPFFQKHFIKGIMVGAVKG